MATVSISGSCTASGNPSKLTAAINNIYGITTSSSTSTNVRSARSKSSSYPASSTAFGKVHNAPGKKFLGSCALSGSVLNEPVEIYAPSAVIASDGGPLEFNIFIDSLHGLIGPFSSITLLRIGASKLVALAGSIIAHNNVFSIFPTKIYSSSIAASGSLLASKVQTFNIALSSSITAVGSSSYVTKEPSLFEQFFYFFHRRHHRS